MSHSTIAKPSQTTPNGQSTSSGAVRRLSDSERMAQGRVQIAEGDYIEGEELTAFLDTLKIPSAKA